MASATDAPLDVETATKENKHFRNVVRTGGRLQLVLMSLRPKEEIGWERHEADQFFRVEDGVAYVERDEKEPVTLSSGDVIIIPGGMAHNISNLGTKDLKLYTIYAPPQHAPTEVED